MSLVGTWNKLTALVAPGSPQTTPEFDPTKNQSFSNSLESIYPVATMQKNWYQALPYGFQFNPRSGSSVVMMLPISPSNLTVTTHFATNLIPTLYGTVEEHSPVRYYDIEIEGTTGITPRYYEPDQKTADVVGRFSFTVDGQINEGLLGGFGAKTLAIINNIKNAASELIDGKLKETTGVYIDQTGYVAFHNLYRFLLKYKRDASGLDGTAARAHHPLTFFNYKDNTRYDVVVRGFVLRRSAENPMLYYYHISLRGFNLRAADQPAENAADVSDRLAALGLDGVSSSSLLSEFKATCSQGRSILGSIGAGINQLGR